MVWSMCIKTKENYVWFFWNVDPKDLRCWQLLAIVSCTFALQSRHEDISPIANHATKNHLSVSKWGELGFKNCSDHAAWKKWITLNLPSLVNFCNENSLVCKWFSVKRYWELPCDTPRSCISQNESLGIITNILHEPSRPITFRKSWSHFISNRISIFHRWKIHRFTGFLKVSWNGGTPNHHPFSISMFHEIDQPFFGVSLFMETTISDNHHGIMDNHFGDPPWLWTIYGVPPHGCRML